MWKSSNKRARTCYRQFMDIPQMVRAKGLMSFKFLCSVCGESCGHKGESTAWVHGKDVLCSHHHEQERLIQLRRQEWEDEYPQEFP